MPAFPDDIASVTNDIAVNGRWTVRVRALTTVDAARAGVLVELLAGLIASPEASRQNVERMAPERLAKADQAVTRILCECVEAGSVDGGPFEPLRLVPERSQHDPKATPPRIWAACIPGAQRGAIAAQALVLHAEAEGILRPFRHVSDPAPADPQGSESLRAEPGGDRHVAA